MEISNLYTRPLHGATVLAQAIGKIFLSIAIFGAYMIGLFLLSKDDRSQVPDASNNPSSDQRTYARYISRKLRLLVARVREICRPTSFYIPMMSTMFVLIYAFRAMENYNFMPQGLEDYKQACPEESRRTATGAYVKLFAATVTTVGLRGHLYSLNDMQFWTFELYRAVETVINPLATVFTFSTVAWYGFVDLLGISPGPWTKDTTLKYRLARLCGCSASTASSDQRRFFLGRVAPQHVETKTLVRDIKWAGRVLILLVLFGQYIQAALLLTRRILSGAAAYVDYAMIFLVLAGTVTLLQSLSISILNVSWSLRADFQPCTESLCSIPDCITFKKDQGHRCLGGSAITFLGCDISLFSKAILYELAGGWLQLTILARRKDSTWKMFMTLFFLQFIWWSSIYYICYLNSFRSLILEKSEPELSNDSQPADQQHDERLPIPATGNNSDSQSNFSIVDWLISIVAFVIGVSCIAWFLMIIAFQLVLLLGPCIALYLSMAGEISSWKDMDPKGPCPHLWKDGLEDELWWF